MILSPLGMGQRRAAAGAVAAVSPYDSPHLYAAFDMRLETGYANNDPIGTLTDRVGGIGDLLSTGTARPLCKTNQLNGHRIALFDGTDDYLAASDATKSRLLHDGSAFTILMVWRPTQAAPTTYQGLIDTGGATSTGQSGLNISYWNDGSTHTAALDGAITNQDTGGAAVTLSTGNYVVNPRVFNTLTIRHKPKDYSLDTFQEINDFRYEVNGIIAGSANKADFLYDTDNPNTGLQVACYSIGGARQAFAAIEVAAIYVFRTALSKEERLAHGLWIEDNFGVGYAVLVTGDSHYNAFGELVDDAARGRYVIGYTKALEHAYDKDVMVSRRSSNGRVWDLERLVYIEPNAAKALGGCNASVGPDGTLWVGTYNETIAAAALDTNSPFLLKSTNGGDAWGSAIPITSHGFTAWCACESKPYFPNSGDANLVEVPVFGLMTSGTYTSAKLMRSTDGGSTWSVRGTIGNGPTDSRSYTEVGLLYVDATTIVAFVRVEGTPLTLYRSVSTDSGQTWSAPAVLSGVDASNMPRPVLLASGNAILSLRENSGNGRAAIYWSSDSAGDYEDWSGPFYPDPIDGSQMSSSALEVEPGVILHALFSEIAAQATPSTGPGATMSFGRVQRINEADIILF